MLKFSIILAQIPNVLTLSRIGAAPILILLLRDENYSTALILFVIAGITDGLDGWIAKRFNCTSELGARMDPIADKVIIVSAYVMLVILGLIPFWLVTLVIFRDLIIVGGYLVISTLDGHVSIVPTKASKANTLFQILLVIVVLVENASWSYNFELTPVMILVVAVSTFLSGIQYLWIWVIRRSVRQLS